MFEIFKFPGNPEIVGTKIERKEDIKVEEKGDEIIVEMPLCGKTPEGTIKCTGIYRAKYKKGVIGPVEVTIVRPK